MCVIAMNSTHLYHLTPLDIVNNNCHVFILMYITNVTMIRYLSYVNTTDCNAAVSTMVGT